jgi:beta-galactosidase
MNQVNSRSEKSSTFFGGSNFTGLNNYDKWWNKQKAGKEWKEKHGKDCGLAWYRKTFTVNPEYKGSKIYLYFGAVDEACSVWVNNQLLLRRPYDPKKNMHSWQEPFTVDISKVVRWEARNTVIVRVENNIGAGGIFKPVSIVTD